MDQGNTNPNNQNPNNPPSTPGNFGVDPNATPSVAPPSNFGQPVAQPPAGEASWANPTTQPVAPVVPPVQPAQPDANPFASAGSTTPAPDPNQNTAPTDFNPFSALSAGSEATPTDLSNLASTSEATSYIPSADASVNPVSTQPEAMGVTPPAGGEQPQAVSASGGAGGFPKIFIVIGGVILLAVIAASAYFILGIGKPTEPFPVPLPAEQATPTPPQAIATPALPIATSSASFSNLPGGASVTPTTTPAGTGNTYDLLRKRAASTPSANP